MKSFVDDENIDSSSATHTIEKVALADNIEVGEVFEFKNN